MDVAGGQGYATSRGASFFGYIVFVSVLIWYSVRASSFGQEW